MQTIIVFALGTIFGAFLTYLTAYMKKKGENFATREDLQGLVMQMSAVTEATKKIEAEISSGVWDKQKRWELRRDVLFEASRSVAAVEDSLLRLNSLTPFQTHGTELHRAKAQLEAGRAYNDSICKFDAARLLVAVACSNRTTISAFSAYSTLAKRIASETMRGDSGSWDKNAVERKNKFIEVGKVVRNELGVDDTFENDELDSQR
jgi:hypothetical protein